MDFLRLAGLASALVLLAHFAAGQKTLQGNDCTAAGAYTLCQNLWGANTGVGSQSTTLLSTNGNSVSWSTTYQWSQSPDNVKSYPNVYHNTAKGMQLQDIVTAPTNWQWYYQSASPDLRADVSYDIWFGAPQSGDPASAASSYEIMIWLSQRGGVGGIGNVVAQNLQIGGHTWTLKHGPNSNWDVFSFITAEGDITNFNADLNDFFQYLINAQGVAKTQFIQAIQVGTEPFTGNADLVITNFDVGVTTFQDQSSSSSPPQPTPTPTPSHTSSQANSASATNSASGSLTSAASMSGNGTVSSSLSSTMSRSSTIDAPVGQTTDTPIQVGIRKAGGTQCRLQAPGRLARRRERRSWLRFGFGLFS
ncbi:concanavalin A-like lectin/glucanase domain-containing protein [Trametes meyenii]|nr:concanavalin A-like lectin/glucanase domain-containing protein [Trametes meyenii]